MQAAMSFWTKKKKIDKLTIEVDQYIGLYIFPCVGIGKPKIEIDMSSTSALPSLRWLQLFTVRLKALGYKVSNKGDVYKISW